MKPAFSGFAALAALSAAALALGACGEIAQDGPKPFAGEDETRSYAGDRFKGDQVLYERTLAERARTQDEYLVIGGRVESPGGQLASRARQSD